MIHSHRKNLEMHRYRMTDRLTEAPLKKKQKQKKTKRKTNNNDLIVYEAPPPPPFPTTHTFLKDYCVRTKGFVRQKSLNEISVIFTRQPMTLKNSKPPRNKLRRFIFNHILISCSCLA